MDKETTTRTSRLKLISYTKLEKWYVSYYLNPYVIESKFPLIELSQIIKPFQERIKKDSYDGKLPVVSKISFKDGQIHLRDENKTGMDLFELPMNYLLVSKINFHQGAVSINNQSKLVCSTHYQPYKIDYKKINGEYLIKTLRSRRFLNYLHYLRADGIKNEATCEFIGKLKIPLPSLDEQNCIIETYQQKIRLVEKKEEEIKKLSQKNATIIDDILGIEELKKNQAKESNKRLKFVSYKDFEKWGADKQVLTRVKYTKGFEVKRATEICNIGSGGTPRRSIKRYFTGNILWVKTGEVVNDVIYDTEEKITEEAVENSSAKKYPKDSLIIAMYGQGKTRGRTAKLGVEATTNQACAVLHEIDNTQVRTDYLWFYFMNEYDRLRELASGNNQPNLNAQMIKDYKVVIPPFDIQDKIIETVEDLKSKIKSLQKEIEENLDRALEEFEKTVFV